MKASEMTNQDLYDELYLIVYDDYFDSQDHERSVLEEAAARLRKMDVLRAKLKVAEDALKKMFNMVFVDCEVAAIAKNALAAIREEGGAK